MFRNFSVLILFCVASIAHAELQITSPQEVCNILSKSGLSTGEWKNNYGYGCNSSYKEIGSGSPLTNNLAYYVDGDKNFVSQAKLVLNINNKSQATSAISALISSSEELSVKLTGEKLPQIIKDAITRGKAIKAKAGKAVIEVKRDDWPTGKGYELHVIFK